MARARRRTSRRPPKVWWKHCVANVKRSGMAMSAERVCGALWARKMGPKAKRRAKRRHPER